MSNSKYLDKEVFCLNCGKSLGFGYKAQKRKYCTNACQVEKRQKDLLEYWLSTGELDNYTGGNSGHTPHNEYTRNYLLLRQNNSCAECGTSPIHNGKPLVFVLDHIDGDPTNHTPGNLRLICPNCDSQSPTFKNRNKGKGRRSRGFTANKGL